MSIYNNILQSDRFVIANKSNNLIELLLKIKNKKMDYPYNKIKKYICKTQDLPIDKKTLDSINLSKIDVSYIFDYFKFNVLYYDSEFTYHDNQRKRTIFIFKDDSIYINFMLDNKYKWRSNKLPDEISLLKNKTDYILKILKYIVQKYNLCNQKMTIVEIVQFIEKYLGKKLSSTEQKLVYNLINPLIGLECFIYK